MSGILLTSWYQMKTTNKMNQKTHKSLIINQLSKMTLIINQL